MAAKEAEKVDLNRANQDELAALPGIGASTAAAIVKYRDEHGGFKNVDELAEVSGVGPQTLDSVRSRLTAKKGGKDAEEAERTAEAAPRLAKEMVEEAAKAGAEATEQGAEAARTTARKAASAGADVAERGAEAGKAAMAAGAEAARQSSGEAIRLAEAVRDSAERGYQQLAHVGRDDFEAVMTSSQAMLETVREMNESWVAYVQDQVRHTMDAGQALARCRSPKELIEVQSDYARDSMERFTAEAMKLSDLAARMASETFRPFQARARQ